jgi:hypothetical protein
VKPNLFSWYIIRRCFLSPFCMGNDGVCIFLGCGVCRGSIGRSFSLFYFIDLVAKIFVTMDEEFGTERPVVLVSVFFIRSCISGLRWALSLAHNGNNSFFNLAYRTEERGGAERCAFDWLHFTPLRPAPPRLSATKSMPTSPSTPPNLHFFPSHRTQKW